MKITSPYHEGHLFVAAVRILEHRHASPPSLDQISKMLGLSAEQTGLICRRLKDEGIVEQVEGAFGDRWMIKNHHKLEDLPQKTEDGQMQKALKQFQAEKNKIAQKVESIKEQQAKKQKELFAEIEKKLKKDIGKPKP